ncbi:MAG TPA: hypothetical protein VK121_11770 [Pseudogracilibacillus sp.]|nr:hypothetical protein [Pseudogracilibacillus sp.]
MIAFFGVISFFIFIIFAIMFVWSLIKRNGKAKRNILISGVSFILLIFLVVIDSEPLDSDELVDKKAEKEEIDQEKAEKEKEEKEKAEKEKIEKEKEEKEKAKKEKIKKEKKEKEKAKKEKIKEEKKEKEKAEKEKMKKEKKEKEKAEKENFNKSNINDFISEEENHADISGKNILIDNITTKIQNGILTIKFRSFNQSGELAVLNKLVTVTAEQSNDFLDEAFDLYASDSDNSYMHMIENSVSYVMEAQYEIRNTRDPIEIMFALTPASEGETWTEEIIELELD